MKASSKPNQHWNLQVTSCPICSADFKIIGKVEEIAEDTIYIMRKGNVSHLIHDTTLNGNTSEDIGPKTNKEQIKAEAGREEPQHTLTAQLLLHLWI